MPTASAGDARATQHQDAEAVELQHVSSLGSAVPPDSHEAVLHGLEQWLPTTHRFVSGGKTYLARDNFAGTEPLWDLVPLVYVPGSPVHPSNAALRTDAAAELARIGGRVVGSITGTAIPAAGTPRLSSHLNLEDDEVRAIHAAGRLALSTGYDARTFPDGTLAGKVEPSHVLLFDSRWGSPNDPKVMFLNLGDSMADDDTKGLLTQIRDLLKGPQPAAFTHTLEPPVAVDTETARKLELANTAKTEAEQKLAAAEAQLAEYRNAEQKREVDAREARWTEMKNLLPKGLTHTPEKEAALRKEYETDPAGFALKIAHANLNAPQGRQAQGASYVNAQGEKTDEQRLGELGYTSLTVSGGAEA
jgi:hypothetical protein